MGTNETDREWWVACGGSLALHVILAGVVWSAQRPPATPRPRVQATRAIELELVVVTPPDQSAVRAPSRPSAQRVASPAPRVTRQVGSQPATTEEAPTVDAPEPVRASLRSDAPVAERAETPRLTLPTVIPDHDVVTRGVTVYRDDARDEAVARARELARVTARINDLTTSTFASLRASNGLADPAVVAWGHALSQTLNAADGGAPAQLGINDANLEWKRHYAQALENYGKTGNPGYDRGDAPEQSETLRDLNAPMFLRATAQSAETQRGLATMGPLLSVTLELEQATSGAILKADLLNHSGNSRFDAFVLAAVPLALSRLPPPSKPVHATWAVEGRLVRDRTALEETANAIALVGPLTNLLPSDAAHAHFEYRARLLSAY